MTTDDVVKKSKGFWGEFREFITKGNVMDMAVGVIIGAAFKAIIGIFIKTESLTSVVLHVGNANITIGNFIAAVINFLILALVLFIMVKVLNRMRETAEKMAHIEKEEKKEEPTPTREEVLLTEIRDLLKKQG